MNTVRKINLDIKSAKDLKHVTNNHLTCEKEKKAICSLLSTKKYSLVILLDNGNTKDFKSEAELEEFLATI